MPDNTDRRDDELDELDVRKPPVGDPRRNDYELKKALEIQEEMATPPPAAQSTVGVNDATQTSAGEALEQLNTEPLLAGGFADLGLDDPIQIQPPLFEEFSLEHPQLDAEDLRIVDLALPVSPPDLPPPNAGEQQDSSAVVPDPETGFSNELPEPAIPDDIPDIGNDPPPPNPVDPEGGIPPRRTPEDGSPIRPDGVEPPDMMFTGPADFNIPTADPGPLWQHPHDVSLNPTDRTADDPIRSASATRETADAFSEAADMIYDTFATFALIVQQLAQDVSELQIRTERYVDEDDVNQDDW